MHDVIFVYRVLFKDLLIGTDEIGACVCLAGEVLLFYICYDVTMLLVLRLCPVYIMHILCTYMYDRDLVRFD